MPKREVRLESARPTSTSSRSRQRALIGPDRTLDHDSAPVVLVGLRGLAAWRRSTRPSNAVLGRLVTPAHPLLQGSTDTHSA